VAGLAASFGRGSMTNHWTDLQNADVIMIIGSNAAENHPISFRWVRKAMAAGGKLISVDPRFTRTSTQADLYAPLRSGTDIAFIGAIINHALATDRIQREYIVAYTNAGFLVNPEYSFDDGLFGETVNGGYTREKWTFQRDADGQILTDPTLEHPDTVFQHLKRHYARYDFETVSRITGTPVGKLEEVATLFTTTHEPGKSATIMYAMGATQSTHATQNIRAYSVLQLLLGNMGMAGGGINALRGMPNVQGSTDHALLFHILPGYLRAPTPEDQSIAAYLERSTPRTADPLSANWWGNYPKYTVSLLKAFWGDAATPDNDFAYHYLPKTSENCSHISLFEAMGRGEIQGLLVFGQNPAVGGPNANQEHGALDRLDWLVVSELFETETAAFWKRPGVDPATIDTEVFLLPAAASVEKQGSLTNSGRWAQWRYQAIEPPGSCRSDLWILDQMYRHLSALYEKEGGALPGAILELAWDCGPEDRVDPHVVAREINGRFTTARAVGDQSFEKGDQVPAFGLLQADGSTSCGNWLYCSSYTGAGNMMARRRRSSPEQDPIALHANWAWCWPVNRRILYNRASCDPTGRPWAPHKAVVAYDWGAARWSGDVPDGPWPPLRLPTGELNPAGRRAFIMLADGQACLFAPGLADGPFPEHYEPLETPIRNLLSSRHLSPAVKVWRPEEVGSADEYPIVGSTYRVSEHFQSGGMTRNMAWLVELVPDNFVEMSRELAALKRIRNGDLVRVTTIRGHVDVRAVVTSRVKPFDIDGRTVHEVGLPYHFGYMGLGTGAIANVLTPHVGDGNTMIPEYKAFLCDVEPVEGGRA
jgi:formate dehydrogenase-N alpha subunit